MIGFEDIPSHHGLRRNKMMIGKYEDHHKVKNVLLTDGVFASKEEEGRRRKA